MKITCIVIDDEPFARKGIEGYIKQIEFLDLIVSCESAIELNTVLKSQKPDLLFLDIEMPYMTGIDFLRTLKDPPKVIITTAYEKFALQGYELDIIDYLLKPVPFDRFLKAANKAYEFFNTRNNDNNSHIFVKTDNKLEKVRFEEILFVEALENYVAIYTNEKKIITHSTLKMMQGKLPVADFIQPHKSYLVNINAINSIEGNILNIDKFQVPVSKYQKEEIMERILNNKLLRK